jgi:hypothetical protein
MVANTLGCEPKPLKVVAEREDVPVRKLVRFANTALGVKVTATSVVEPVFAEVLIEYYQGQQQ